MPDRTLTFTPRAIVDQVRTAPGPRTVPAQLDPVLYRVDWIAVARSLAMPDDRGVD